MRMMSVLTAVMVIALSSTVSALENFPSSNMISAFEAYNKFKKGDAVFIDAMGTDKYAKMHILGAINMPNNGKKDLEFVRNMPMPFAIDQEIIVYCE